jgi:hypothetical protein
MMRQPVKAVIAEPQVFEKRYDMSNLKSNTGLNQNARILVHGSSKGNIRVSAGLPSTAKLSGADRHCRYVPALRAMLYPEPAAAQ